MRISGLKIDNFGVWSQLRLDGFSSGLNVFYGPNGSGKTTLKRFLRDVLYGFQQSPEGEPLSSSGPIGGSLEITTPREHYILHRRADSSPRGTLEIQSADGTRHDSTLIHALISHVDQSVYDAWFSVGFRDAPPLDSLVSHEIQDGAGFAAAVPARKSLDELLEHLDSSRQKLLNTPGSQWQIGELAARRNKLSAEVAELVAASAFQHERFSREYQQIRPEIARLRAEIVQLRRDVQSVEARILELEQPAMRLAAPTLKAPHGRQAVKRIAAQLAALDAQIERWRRVWRDAKARQAKLQNKLSQWETGFAAQGQIRLSGPRQCVGALEELSRELQAEVSKLSPRTAAHVCKCQTASDRLAPLADSMQNQIYTLCEELSRQASTIRQRSVKDESRQLARCQHELKQHLKKLLERRQTLLDQLSVLDQNSARLRSHAHRQFCQCADHDGYLDGQADYSPVESAAGDDTSAECSVELAQLRRRHDELLVQVRSSEAALDELFERQNQLDQQRKSLAHDRSLAGKQLDLKTTEQQLQSAVNRWQILSTASSLLHQVRANCDHRPRNLVLEEASAILARLTSGQFVWIRKTPEDRVLLIESAAGQAFRVEALSRGTRDHVYLSLCLATAAAYAGRGVHLPLVLDDPFVNIDAHHARVTAELLCDYCQSGGHQILLLTCHQHIASLFTSLNVPVRNLPVATKSAPIQSTDTVNHSAHREHIQRPVSPARSQDVVVVREWNCEEFPGELADQVRARSQNAARSQNLDPTSPNAFELVHVTSPVAAPVNGDHHATASDIEDAASLSGDHVQRWRFRLKPSSPIEDAPSISLATARQLRAIGVTTVSDLLSLSSDTTAALLAHLPINGATIRRWQAEARLMCRIPRLRAYDARMLVACGITDPRELERMAPDELRGIVRRFLATEEGDRMARSGSDQELSRVKKWIRSAKHASLRRDAESSDRAQRGQGSTGKMRRRRKRRTATAERRHASWTPRVVGQDISPTDQPPMDQPPTDQPVAASAASHSARAARREDKTGETRSRRFYLEPSSSAEAAPSIGPKTAERLAAIGVHTVIDLLKIVPEDAAVELGNRRIKPDTIRDWQAQATLVCRVPHLRGHDAQILVACGVREPEQLAAQNPHELFAKVDPFVTTREGERIVRAGKKPDLAEVTDWIEWAKHPRPLRAA